MLEIVEQLNEHEQDIGCGAPRNSGAPLKPRLDASGAASATAGSAPVFFKAALPVFFVEHRSFFSAPATDFLLKQEEFFSALQTHLF